MSHTVTGKLNKAARQHQAGENTIFFVDIGEKNYNRKTKENGWTNYSAALFAKGNQVEFYQSALVEGAIVSVTGTGIIIDTPDNPQYSARLELQDSKLVFVSAGQQAQQQPQQQPMQQPAPQQQPFNPNFGSRQSPQNQPMGVSRQAPQQAFDPSQPPF